MKPTIMIAVYLDTDIEDNDLLDNVGNNITAGWYVYDWPNSWEELAGPFNTEAAAKAWRP